MSNTEVACIDIFLTLDSDGDGFLSFEQVEAGMRLLGVAPPSRHLTARFFHERDISKVGKIDFNGFELFYYSRKKELKRIFEDLSTLDNDAISGKDLEYAILQAGIKISSEQLRKVTVYIKQARVGKLSIDDFNAALLSLPTVNPEAAFEEITNSSFVDVAQSEYSPPVDNHVDVKSSKDGNAVILTKILQQLYYGGIAGVISRTCTAPIDRLKVLSQAAPPGSRSDSMLTVVRSVYGEGGVKAFFRGNFVNCVKVAPETATKFITFDWVKGAIAVDPTNVTVMERFIAGGFAGSITQLLVYPLEIVKTRMAVCIPGTYNSIAHCLRKTVADEGFRALYKGSPTSVAGIIPYAGIDLCSNSIMKEYMARYYQSRGQEPGVWVVITSGILSSSLGMVCTYPINLIRTRLQTSGMPGSRVYRSALDCFRQTVAADGFIGLYKGIVPNMMKVIPAASISYTVYDVLMKSTHDPINLLYKQR